MKAIALIIHLRRRKLKEDIKVTNGVTAGSKTTCNIEPERVQCDLYAYIYIGRVCVSFTLVYVCVWHIDGTHLGIGSQLTEGVEH